MLINILSYHSQHFQRYRARMTLVLSCLFYTTFNVWINDHSGLCMPNLHAVNLYIEWFLAMKNGGHAWCLWMLLSRAMAPMINPWSLSWDRIQLFKYKLHWISNINGYLSWSVCPEMLLCCFYIMNLFVYSMLGGVICQHICHLILFRVLIKEYQVTQSW